MNVIFEVMELPLIAGVNFDGLRFVTAGEIEAELREQKLNIEVGAIYNVVKIRKARQKITEYLSRRGFSDAKVIISEEQISSTTLAINFNISEQPNLKIEDY